MSGDEVLRTPNSSAWWKAEADGWKRENDRHRSLYVEAVKERDRLRAVVDAVREHRALVARLIGEDHEPEEEIGLDEAQWASWRRITEMLDQLDVSPTMGERAAPPTATADQTREAARYLQPGEVKDTLRAYRQSTGLTVDEIAGQFDVSRRAVTEWLRGGPMTAAHRERLASSPNAT